MAPKRFYSKVFGTLAFSVLCYFVYEKAPCAAINDILRRCFLKFGIPLRIAMHGNGTFHIHGPHKYLRAEVEELCRLMNQAGHVLYLV